MINDSRGTDMLKKIFFPLWVISFAGCSSGAQNPAFGINQQPAADAIKLEQKIGWFHGQCLAIKRADLPAGSTIRISQLDSKNFVDATVLAATEDSEKCPPLASDRRGINLAEGNFFYLVSGLDPMSMGIGVTGDIGPLDSFTFDYCQTTEGMRFEARKKGNSEPVWTGYYYLGYESEPSCPADD